MLIGIFCDILAQLFEGYESRVAAGKTSMLRNSKGFHA